MYFEFSFSRSNFFERKERERILRKAIFKNFVYPGGGFFIHLFIVH